MANRSAGIQSRGHLAPRDVPPRQASESSQTYPGAVDSAIPLLDGLIRWTHLASLSLRDKLFLSFLAILLLSFVLTGTVFWIRVQEYTDNLTRTHLQLASSVLIPPVRRALINPDLQSATTLNATSLSAYLAPLIRPFRSTNTEILLTGWDDRVIYPPNSPFKSFPVSYSTTASQFGPLLLTNGHRSVDGHTYVFTAQPAMLRTSPIYAELQSPTFGPNVTVHNVILIEDLDAQAQIAITQLGGQMAIAVAVALLAALVIALLLVRYITRPLLRMTDASERMAAGDYDQYIPLQSNDEVGQLAGSFNRMAYEVRRARQLQREFVGNVSHDLKTPLTSILGFSQVLTDGDLEPAMAQRAATVINQEARRLQRLTLDLLDLTRIEAGQISLRFDELDLNILLADIFGRYTTLGLRADVELRGDFSTTPLLILGDSDRLTQVIVNLLDNAIKFCRSGGTVVLASAIEGANAEFTITNSSDGIPPDQLARIFERFYRTDHARSRREGGTGLGLAIVKELVAAHHGQVVAESELDRYVRFRVTIPLAPGMSHSVTPIVMADDSNRTATTSEHAGKAVR